MLCYLSPPLGAGGRKRSYLLVRLDRNRNGGGVLFYVSTDLHCSVLPKCDGLELLSIVISNGFCKVCISLFYRPPSSSPPPPYLRVSLYLH